jgi:hypothetical protein
MTQVPENQKGNQHPLVTVWLPVDASSLLNSKIIAT